MATTTNQRQLSPPIRSTLAALRRRIRTYILCEGIALALIWLGSAFWIGLALDYLPVVLGASEMPRPARAFMLILVVTVLVYILYRWTLRRLFVRLSNRNLAVLLERRYGDFLDSLVTSVELVERSQDSTQQHRQMLTHCHQHAQEHLQAVQLRRIFNFAPLLRGAVAAGVLGTMVLLLSYWSHDSFLLAARRLYLLSPEPWPRQAEISIDGFQDRSIKVARGSNYILRVFADSRKRIPNVCTVYYSTEQGDRGRVAMRTRGRSSRDRRQEFVYDGTPFKGILSTINFDVLGYDHRLRDYTVQVVDSPTLTEVLLACTFPDYLVDEQVGVYLPRTERLTSGTRLPQGTRIQIRATADKPLTHVEFVDALTEQVHTQEVENTPGKRTEFAYDIPELKEDVALNVILHDTDGVSNERPFRIVITAVQDAVPRVDMVLRGIGTVITPQALIPMAGQISDENRLDRAWFELQQRSAASNDQTAPPQVKHEFPFRLVPGNAQRDHLDLRELQRIKTDPVQLNPGDKIIVSVKAMDKFDLEPGPHFGSSDPYELDVVTTDRLLAHLETREIELRRRLEQIIDELHGTRDALVRVRSSAEPGSPNSVESEKNASEPGDDRLDEAAAAERETSLRLLRVQRSRQDVQRSESEVYGVGVAFDDIRLELINNRVDTVKRNSRLKEEIADPLKDVAQTQYPKLTQTLKALELGLGDVPLRSKLSATAITQLDDILLELDEVLRHVLDLETYNELVDIVRSIIEDQGRLIEDTQQQQQAQALDLLQ